jgi:tetratricopeptide (TPR) repeat protein
MKKPFIKRFIGLTTLLLFFLLLIPPINFFGQTKTIDSIRTVIKTTTVDTTKVKALIQLGTELFESSSFNELNGYFEEAKDLAKKINYKNGYSHACTILGILYFNQGLYDRALESHLISLKIREESGDPKRIAACAQNLGIVCVALKNYDKAFEYYYYVLKVRTELKDTLGMAGAFQGIGITYQYKGDYKSALDYFLKSLKMREALKDSASIASIYTNIGGLQMKTGEYNKALESYMITYNIRKKKTDSDMQMVYANFAQVYNKLKKYNDALKYCNMSRELIEKAGNSLDQLKNNEMSYSEIYQSMNKPVEALDHYKKYITYRDSIYNEENTKKAVQTEMNFEFKKKEEAVKAENDRKMAVAAEEKRIKNIIIISISIGLALVFILVLVILRSLLQNKQKNKIITQQKEMVEAKQKEVMDSIHYAKRIQQSLLPTDKYIQRNLKK